MVTRKGKVMSGFAGMASEVLFTLEDGDPKDVTATLSCWLLCCPGQSPAWHHYHFSLIHLRPIEGVKPAVIKRPGATHEVMLFALDSKRKPVADDHRTWSWLTPLNFVGQLTLPSDESAKKAAETLVRAVVDGILWAEPPLSGQSEPWESQLRQLEDHAAGKHFN